MKLIGKEKQNESIHFINDEVSQQVVIVLQAK